MVADDGFAILGKVEGFGEISSAAAQGGDGANESGEELGLVVESLEGTVSVEFEHDAGELIASESDEVLVEAVDGDGLDTLGRFQQHQVALLRQLFAFARRRVYYAGGER